jgi:hypothetical protein
MHLSATLTPEQFLEGGRKVIFEAVAQSQQAAPGGVTRG